MIVELLVALPDCTWRLSKLRIPFDTEEEEIESVARSTFQEIHPTLSFVLTALYSWHYDEPVTSTTTN